MSLRSVIYLNFFSQFQRLFLIHFLSNLKSVLLLYFMIMLLLINSDFSCSFFPLSPAYGILKHIIHSHYDGAYSCFSEVSDDTKELWWKEFQVKSHH